MNCLVVAPLSRVLFDEAGAGATSPGDRARQARAVGEAWRDEVCAALASQVELVPWDESPREPVETVPLPAASLRAVRYLAFVADQSEVAWPDDLPADLDAEPRWSAASRGGFEQTPLAQVVAPEVWVPGDFRATCKTEDPSGGASLVAGSVDSLIEQLELLNGRTFQLDLGAVRGSPGDESFIGHAGRGLVSLYGSARCAAESALPLVVVEGNPFS